MERPRSQEIWAHFTNYSGSPHPSPPAPNPVQSSQQTPGLGSVADLDPFDTDSDPDFHFDTDPEHAFQFETDPGPAVWSGSLPFQRGTVPKKVGTF